MLNAIEDKENCHEAAEQQETQSKMDDAPDDWRQHHVMWTELLLSEQFSVLLYGDGSKREVVRDYATTVLKDCNYIIFHGYKMRVNAKAILDTINKGYGLGVRSKGVSLSDFARRIGEALEKEEWELFVLVLNIDGPALRLPAQQEALSILSQSVYLMATVDNKCAGLMWSPQVNDTFSWVCTELNTGLEVDEERLDKPSKGRRKTQGHTHSSLEAFWRATTKNQHKILETLAEHATSVEDRDQTDPLTLPELCAILKKQFATTNETNLRQQLTELFDHGIIQEDQKSGGILLAVNKGVMISFIEGKQELERD